MNEKINISSILNNQNVNELEISLVYNDLPTIIYDLFTINYPVLSDSSKKYTLSGNVQKQWGNLTRTIKFTINNRDLDALFGSLIEGLQGIREYGFKRLKNFKSFSDLTIRLNQINRCL